MKREKFLDLVIAGPDMSGTSTQIEDSVEFFQKNNLNVRDIRGTEIDALFQTKKFSLMNSLYSFVFEMPKVLQMNFLFRVNHLMSGGGTNQDLKIASAVKNDVSTYLDPNSADVWVMEEPTKRGAGQVNRTIEQNRSSYGFDSDHIAAALSHQAYRVDEFLRFRNEFRKNNKIILRSRSEESACYQIYDCKDIPTGIKMDNYLNLPGHKIAFGNAPTNIFVVCGPENWTTQQYLELKKERSKNRNLDDYEKNANYQVLVNQRYATDWLENLYEKGCKLHGGKIPKISRFNIYDSKIEIREKMRKELSSLI